MALGISGHQSEIIELALSNGFSGIDVNMTEFATRVRLKGMPYAKRLLASAKIRVGTFSLPLDWDSDDETFKKEVAKLPEYGEYAAEVGCTRTTMVLTPAGDQRPYHENFEFHRHRLQEVCTTLAPSGLRLAVGFRATEQHRRDKAFQFIHDLDALTLLVNMAAAPNLGLLVDVWEIVACGASVEDVRKLSPEQVVAVQVADMPADVPLAELDDRSRILPGGEGGRINVASFLAILHEMQYDGPVTVKASKGAFQSRRREMVVKQTAEALDKVWRAAGVPPTARPSLATARDS